jgi:Protein of unknown function (DUF4233)
VSADDDEAGFAGLEEWRHDRADDDGAGMNRGGPPACGGEWRHDEAPAQPPGGSKPDPWKSFRGVTAGTLILEAIVVLLALPVVDAVGGGLSAGALTYLLGLAAVLILLAGLQGRSWAIWADLAVQLIPIAGFAVYPGVGFIGLLFAAVWALILYVRSEVLRRERLGLLPGQDGPPD